MNQISIDSIKEKLASISYPGFTRDIVSFGVIDNIEIGDRTITVRLKFTTKSAETKTQVKDDVQKTLEAAYPDSSVQVIEDIEHLKTKATKTADDPWAGIAPIPGIKSIIAVASGKGGVGKSTVSTNLAIAMAKKGLKVGLMDSDIYGPSIHIMMGVDDRPMVTESQRIIPIEKYGIKMMSMGFLVDRDAPLIWRGPLVMKAVEQFLRDVEWEELDVLVIDLPPGTGDAQLTLVQKTPITGAVIVTTPQEVALVDARKGLKMFQKVETRVLGIVENMSYFICSHCGEKSYIFGQDGGRESAEELGVPLLGQIPIESQVREAGDAGEPIVARYPDSQSAQAFMKIADKIIADEMFK